LFLIVLILLRYKIKTIKYNRIGHKSVKLITEGDEFQVIYKSYFFSVQIYKKIYNTSSLQEAEDIYAELTQNLKYEFMIKR
jgi:ribosomal 50S subunit-recycling heat shock protein